jgi:hypothetical protein
VRQRRPSGHHRGDDQHHRHQQARPAPPLGSPAMRSAGTASRHPVRMSAAAWLPGHARRPGPRSSVPAAPEPWLARAAGPPRSGAGRPLVRAG